MKNQIQVFQSEEFGKVRVVEKDGQPWWVLKDVCSALGLRNPTIVASRLDDDEVTKFNLGSLSGVSNIISESGLYAVILRSNKPQARTFRKWITADVIPSIRIHGAYIDPDLLKLLQENHALAKELLDDLEEEERINESLVNFTSALIPKAAYHDAILQSTVAMPISIIAKDYGMTAIEFNRMLHDLGVQYKVGGTWLLYKEYTSNGYTVSKTYQIGGEITVHTCWTQRGRRFLYDFLAWEGIYPNVDFPISQAAVC